jgi:hypothetical protein
MCGQVSVGSDQAATTTNLNHRNTNKSLHQISLDAGSRVPEKRYLCFSDTHDYPSITLLLPFDFVYRDGRVKAFRPYLPNSTKTSRYDWTGELG